MRQAELLEQEERVNAKFHSVLSAQNAQHMRIEDLKRRVLGLV
jgi:hypothetical protein